MLVFGKKKREILATTIMHHSVNRFSGLIIPDIIKLTLKCFFL